MGVSNLGDLFGVLVGHATDEVAMTGCTVVIFPEGAVAGHVAWGTATGSRELATLTPRHLVNRIHGICLCGGSAFGLAAVDGVMQRLEQERIGHQTSCGKVPIVAGAVVYDLNLGDSAVRPDAHMGAMAADAALSAWPVTSGNVGVGTGVSSGKILGIRCATKTGVGNSGISTEEGLAVAALAVVNPVGDVLDWETGEILAGARKAPDSNELVGTTAVIRASATCDPLHSNTTLCVLATTARLTRVEASWVAEQALVTLSRCLDPPFTRHDGDVVFCASTGSHESDLHRVAILSRDALAAAIKDACLSAAPAGGLPNYSGLIQPR